MNDREYTAKKIAELRQARNLSQSELGVLCGYGEGKSSQSRIGNYESAYRGVSNNELKKIADALHVDVDILLPPGLLAVSKGPSFNGVGEDNKSYESEVSPHSLKLINLILRLDKANKINKELAESVHNIISISTK